MPKYVLGDAGMDTTRKEGKRGTKTKTKTTKSGLNAQRR
jgi:hypothetical protein